MSTASTPTPSQALRARAVEAQGLALALATEQGLPEADRRTLRDLLDWHLQAKAYEAARAVLATIRPAEPPTVRPPVSAEQAVIAAVVCRWADCDDEGVASAAAIVGRLRRLWIGDPADAPHREALRGLGRTLHARQSR